MESSLTKSCFSSAQSFQWFPSVFEQKSSPYNDLKALHHSNLSYVNSYSPLLTHHLQLYCLPAVPLIHEIPPP